MPPDTQKLEQEIRLHAHTGSDLTKKIQMDWELVGQFILQTAGTSMIITGLPARRYFRLYIQHGVKASIGNTLLRFNGDSGNNYSSISEENNTARTSASSIDLFDALNDTSQFFFTVDIINRGDLAKSVVSEGVQILTAASATQVKRQVYGSWINTNAFINRIDVVSSGGNFPVESSLMVLSS